VNVDGDSLDGNGRIGDAVTAPLLPDLLLDPPFRVKVVTHPLYLSAAQFPVGVIGALQLFKVASRCMNTA
jgi:hypothetical protein